MRSMAARHAAQNGTSSRVNMMQSVEAVFVPRRGQRNARYEQRRPLGVLWVGGDVPFPGLGTVRLLLVRRRRGEVLVRQAGEVVRELVHEDVGRLARVGGDSGVKGYDPASPVGRRVGDDLDQRPRRRSKSLWVSSSPKR